MLTEGSQFLPNWTAPALTSSSSAVVACPYDLSIVRINIKIISNYGTAIALYVPITITVADVKQEAVHEFHLKNQLPELFDCDTDNLLELSEQYKLTRINRIHSGFDETMSLAAANIQNNEEFLFNRKLNAQSTSHGTMSAELFNDYNNAYDASDIPNITDKKLCGPTQSEIDAATANIAAKYFKIPAMVNIDELVLQSDVGSIYHLKKNEMLF